MTKKLSEIAEVKALTPNTNLLENDILVSRTGKKIFKLGTDDIKEYQNKSLYLIITAKPEFVDAILNTLTSIEFSSWVSANTKGKAMPLINVVQLKEFTINL